jgi:oxygen-dependent protoporphyrinogen oxidase
VSTVPKDVVIVGGGPAGMAAAWQLRDKEIVLLERHDALGGRTKSHDRGDYWLNLGAHLFPGGDSHVRHLMRDLGLETVEVPGSKTALSLGGRVYDARRIESYPFVLPLSVRERVQLVRAGLKIRLKVMSFISAGRQRPGETEAARRARVARFDRDRTFEAFLGRLPRTVDAIFRTAARRVPAEMGELSAAAGISIFAGNWAGRASGSPVNLRGGSGRLGAAVRDRLRDRVVLGADVSSVSRQEDGLVVVHYDTANGPTSVTARHVIVATPAPVASRLVPELPSRVAQALTSVAYAPFVSMAVLTDEDGPMPWDDIYAVLTPGRSFNMVFNHANPLRGTQDRKAGGSLMCYAGAAPAEALIDLSDDEIERRFLGDLEEVFPQLAGLVKETVVQRWDYGNWYQTPSSDVEALLRYGEEPGNVIHLAGDYFAAVSGSVEEAATSGVEAAVRVVRALGA